MLRCPNCQTTHTDPGGDPRQYSCGVCGYSPLQRIGFRAEPLAGAIVGATIGATVGGPLGAVIGGIAGLILGNNVRPQRK
jgi:hypothetical protein